MSDPHGIHEVNMENPIRAALRRDTEEICKLTDLFCATHLDQEYAGLCRKLVAKLARKRPSPLTRGDLRIIWAAATVHAVGGVNFLFEKGDRTQRSHLAADELSRLTGGAKSTVAAKARIIRDALGLFPMHPDFCRRSCSPRTRWSG